MSTRNEVAQFKSSWQSDFATIGTEVSSFDLKRYTPIGTSPKKKLWSYPTELTRTRPEAEIITHYRSLGETVPIIDPLFEAKRIAEASLKALKEPKTEIKESDAGSDLSSDAHETPEPAPIQSEEPKSQPAPTASAPAPVSASTSASAPVAGPTKPKPKPLHPVNGSAPRGPTKTSSAANIPVNRGQYVAVKPGPNGRENPKPAQSTHQSSANTSARPVLKRTNSQQQLVGNVGRKPMDVTNTIHKQ